MILFSLVWSYNAKQWTVEIFLGWSEYPWPVSPGRMYYKKFSPGVVHVGLLKAFVSKLNWYKKFDFLFHLAEQRRWRFDDTSVRQISRHFYHTRDDMFPRGRAHLCLGRLARKCMYDAITYDWEIWCIEEE